MRSAHGRPGRGTEATEAALFDLVDTARRLSIPSLVEHLREVHDGGAGSPTGPLPIESLLTAADPNARSSGFARSASSLGRKEPTLPTSIPGGSVFEPVLDLLRRAGNGLATIGPESEAPTNGEDRGRRRDRYDEVRRLFRQREERLRRQACLTDRVLHQLESGQGVASAIPSSPLQQELRVICPAGGSSGGRFLLCNETGRPVTAELRIRPLVEDRSGTPPKLSVEPPSVRLAPDEERLVRFAVDLAGCVIPEGELDVVIDALADEELLMKLWITVRVALGTSDAARPER